ncbi:nitronate monooxygenase family protein [Thermosulfurimonas sp. F29]|uniref:NAD(P)H-dependent flavin oxidoreductase n=1 Tax=Thermosulfurimonas sp. F29 TaxID=2867247 RepID=UPI001C838D8D|nr:nitronate monooxygenase family protein [Thermosulfurimonas sp. F29]MBX6422604.1 nitronate monooxygenase family protein [Thermosulfurimonas sp. F29]
MERDFPCEVPPLRIGDLTARVPIVQGGMGVGISLAGLASAVAREGAVGVISAALVGFYEGEAEFFRNPTEANIRGLKRQIRLAREKAPGGIIGVNIMVALTDFEPLCRAACEAGADIIFAGAGLPLNLPELRPEGSSTRLAPIVSSARAAKLVAQRWWSKYGYVPDAVVVEGPMAGGHLGFSPEKLEAEESRLEVLVPRVIEAMKPFEDKAGRAIPVIAAGGIYTGRDIYRYLHEIGAAGVQMGTRFVATHECNASPAFKEAFVRARKEDLTIIKSPVGLPGRALKGTFLKRVEAGEKRPYRCIYHCLRTCDYRKSPYCIAAALINAQRGNLEAGFVFAGANAWRVDRIVSVRELIEELIRDYCAARLEAEEGGS